MNARSSGSSPLIAIMNSSRDLVNVLKTSLELDGFRTATHISTIDDGVAGPLAFLRAEQPDATVYAVSPPYREGWEILQGVQAQWSDRNFVVTTTNIGGLRSCVGPANAIEIIGKPFDLDEITEALRRLLDGHVRSADVAVQSGTRAS